MANGNLKLAGNVCAVLGLSLKPPGPVVESGGEPKDSRKQTLAAAGNVDQGGSGWKLEPSVCKDSCLSSRQCPLGLCVVTTMRPATGRGEACTVWQGADLSPVDFYPKHLPIWSSFFP